MDDYKLYEEDDDEGCETVSQNTSYDGFHSDESEYDDNDEYSEDYENDDGDEEDDDDENEDDPSMYAHCGDWEDEPENCAFCADDECPMNRS